MTSTRHWRNLSESRRMRLSKYSDYRGNYIVAMHNDSEETRIVEPGERIAQMVVIPYLSVTFEESDTLTDTERGDGGFGSTGKK